MVYLYEAFYIETDLEISVILEFCLHQEINQHTVVEIKGIGQISAADIMISEQEKLTIKDSEGKAVFMGCIYDTEIDNLDRSCTFKIKAISNTYQLDILKRKRVFQNLDFTYQDIIGEVLLQYPGAEFLDTSTEGKKIPHMIIQYEETDWEFIKRLISHFHQGICVNSQSEAIQIYCGFPKRECIKIEGEVKKIIKNIKDNQVSFNITTPIRYEPGSRVEYEGMKYLLKSFDLYSERGESHYHNHLCQDAAVLFPYIPNYNIKGARLWAYAKEINCNFLRLQFQIDDLGGKNLPFLSYAGEVNNEDGYYMPEPGDEVEVYFPNGEEKGFIDTTRRRIMKIPSGSKSTMKYMRNKEGNELYMDEEKIRLAVTDKNAAIELSADGTLRINSLDTILLKTGKNIELGGQGGRVSISAGQGISLYSGAGGKNKIVLEDSGNITCKSTDKILYKKNPDTNTTDKPMKVNQGAINSAHLIRNQTLALAGVEFLTQSVTGKSDSQDAQNMMNRLLNKTNKESKETEGSEGNFIKEKLFQNDNRLYSSFSYGENKNGG